MSLQYQLMVLFTAIPYTCTCYHTHVHVYGIGRYTL